jgi:hypothetical protein
MVVRTEAQHANVPFSVFDKTLEEFCELSLGMTPNELGVVFEGFALQGLKGASISYSFCHSLTNSNISGVAKNSNDRKTFLKRRVTTLVRAGLGTYNI